MVRGTRIELASIRVRACCVTLTPTPHGVGRLGIEPSSRRVKAGCISLMLTSRVFLPGATGLVLMFHCVALVGSGGIEPLAIGHCFTGSLDTMSWSGPETTEEQRGVCLGGLPATEASRECGSQRAHTRSRTGSHRVRGGCSTIEKYGHERTRVYACGELARRERCVLRRFGMNRLAAEQSTPRSPSSLVSTAARGWDERS